MHELIESPDYNHSRFFGSMHKWFVHCAPQKWRNYLYVIVVISSGGDLMIIRNSKPSSSQACPMLSTSSSNSDLRLSSTLYSASTFRVPEWLIKYASVVICQKRVRVFHQGLQTPRNRWKHEAADWVLLFFRGVWNPWWNTKHKFLTWLLNHA